MMEVRYIPHVHQEEKLRYFRNKKRSIGSVGPGMLSPRLLLVKTINFILIDQHEF